MWIRCVDGVTQPPADDGEDESQRPSELTELPTRVPKGCQPQPEAGQQSIAVLYCMFYEWGYLYSTLNGRHINKRSIAEKTWMNCSDVR